MISVLCSACAEKGCVALQHGNIRNLRRCGLTYHLSFMSSAKTKNETCLKMSVLLLHVMFKVLSFGCNCVHQNKQKFAFF